MRLPTLVLACLLGLLAPALVPPTGAAGDDPAPRAGAGRTDRPPQTSSGVPQTSDGVPGAIAREVAPSLRGSTRRVDPAQWAVAPGVTASQWSQSTTRGPISASLLSVVWATPGVRLDYGNAGPVRRTAPMSAIVARERAVAGVNGDFFDIADTGAPIGIGIDRERGLLHGRRVGWNSAFTIGRDGTPDIDTREVVTQVRQHPGIEIATFNAPNVPPASIGVYTRAWGRTAGAGVTDGRKRHVRVVRVVRGKVVSNNHRLPRGTKIKGFVLIGRGPAARKLRPLRVGTRANLRTTVQGAPRMAITGSEFLVRDGLVTATDDRILHPRTAIGIDHDTGTVLLLVVDGRQPGRSRGYTLVELADKMVELGADDVLNLDGGGSSTMVANRPALGVGVVNAPSGGVERNVPNGVVVRYRAPS